MKTFLPLILLFLSISIFGQDLDLAGEWVIDLRPTPDAEGYYQPFVITAINENRIEGTFYGSSIENGLINVYWEKLYFAFSTKDQNHSYYHSGYLKEGNLYGISYCPGRQFTAPWTGTRK